ncbi:hypothetical protein yc1106_09455 [Curvularia clavata]|uniref:F-box domain-containing protein n=1 Tax=Curvularia clavata TaxID=95742 RepID=A0A9Q8ZF34_CURCL|nr:hypothetical protein yc1106_09455 [Curvularia clavata]
MLSSYETFDSARSSPYPMRCSTTSRRDDPRRPSSPAPRALSLGNDVLEEHRNTPARAARVYTLIQALSLLFVRTPLHLPRRSLHAKPSQPVPDRDVFPFSKPFHTLRRFWPTIRGWCAYHQLSSSSFTNSSGQKRLMDTNTLHTTAAIVQFSTPTTATLATPARPSSSLGAMSLLKTSPFSKLSSDHVLEICKHLSVTDLYHLALTSRKTMAALHELYKHIRLTSPSSAQGFRLLESMADPQTPFRAVALTSLRIDGASPKDPSPLPRGSKGSETVEAILEQCLLKHLPSNAAQGVQDAVDKAYGVCRASVYASTHVGLASLVLAATLAKSLKSIEWLMAGTGLESTPLNLLKLMISAKVACSVPAFPALCHLAWRLDSADAYVPIVPSLKSLIIHGAANQEVNFDLTAMTNSTESQLMEVAVLGMEMIIPLTELSLLGHLRHLRILRMRDFARPYTQNYRTLFTLLGRTSPQLEAIELDFEYMDFNDRAQPTILKSLQPDLHLLTNLKHAKIHTQLLWPSPFGMDLRRMYDMLPPNLEYLLLVGLNLSDFLQLDENEDEEEDDGENDEEMVGPDEAEDDALEQDDFDPFLLRDLCTGLPHLTQLGFRFDFHANTRPDLDQELQRAGQDLERLVARAPALGLTLGIYLPSFSPPLNFISTAPIHARLPDSNSCKLPNSLSISSIMPRNSSSARIKIKREPSPLEDDVDDALAAFSPSGAAQHTSSPRHNSRAQRHNHQVRSGRASTDNKRHANKLRQRAQVVVLRAEAGATELLTQAAEFNARAEALKLRAKAKAAKLCVEAAQLELNAIEEDIHGGEEEVQQEVKEEQEEREKGDEQDKEDEEDEEWV